MTPEQKQASEELDGFLRQSDQQEARDAGLITCITDNGAGGLSSSIGEMAEYTNGCQIDLGKVPLKQEGLSSWEILVSESQERMTVAVKESDVPAFEALANTNLGFVPCYITKTFLAFLNLCIHFDYKHR